MCTFIKDECIFIVSYLVYFQYEEWNTHDRQLLGYIKTKATPSIFYLPTEHTQKTKQLLEETKSAIEGKMSTVVHTVMI